MPKQRVKTSSPNPSPKPKLVTPRVPTRRVQNVSLQAWAIPTKGGTVHLPPGHAIEIPVSVINERLINLQKRRLVLIS